MLDPRDRTLLLESLRPPEGYRLDRAIGTTYSLDLVALLVAPLAFTYFDWEDAEGRPVADPLALLESVRRHADRILVFTQAGEIKLPPPTQRLVAYLERSVVPVRAPHELGIFHPKVWLVRYVADGEPVRYRLLCLTRNLTFDRCWDSILCLDGSLLDRQNAIRANRPLGDFVAALPGMALRPMREEDAASVARLADEVRRVRFEPPPDIEEIAFHPLGIPGYGRWLFHHDRARRPILIVSPFLSSSLLDRLTDQREHCTLISRPDQLATLPPPLMLRFRETFALNPTAEDPEDDRDNSEISSLAGLHAKLFIEDDGWNARIYTGSCNATNAAFERNVEFMVELVGKKGKTGIDAFLGDPALKEGIRPLLTPWSGEPIEPSEEQRLREELEARLVETRRALASHPLTLACERAEGISNGYCLALRSEAPLSDDIRSSLHCWPAMLRPDAAKRPEREPGAMAVFGPMALDAVTAFLACELTMTQAGVTCSSRFVLNLPLTGLPEDRLQRLLAAQMQNTEQLLRLLFLLLSASTAAVDLQANLAPSEESSAQQAGWTHATLFERMVRGMVDMPRSIVEAGRLIDELDRTEEGRAVVPDALRSLWTQIRSCIGDKGEPA